MEIEMYDTLGLFETHARVLWTLSRDVFLWGSRERSDRIFTIIFYSVVCCVILPTDITPAAAVCMQSA